MSDEKDRLQKSIARLTKWQEAMKKAAEEAAKEKEKGKK